jgi:hypothetical protein
LTLPISADSGTEGISPEVYAKVAVALLRRPDMEHVATQRREGKPPTVAPKGCALAG